MKSLLTLVVLIGLFVGYVVVKNSNTNNQSPPAATDLTPAATAAPEPPAPAPTPNPAPAAQSDQLPACSWQTPEKCPSVGLKVGSAVHVMMWCHLLTDLHSNNPSEACWNNTEPGGYWRMTVVAKGQLDPEPYMGDQTPIEVQGTIHGVPVTGWTMPIFVKELVDAVRATSEIN